MARWPFRTPTSDTPVTEVTRAPATATVPPPRGYAYGVPSGGTTEYNQGDGGGVGGTDRQQALEELWQAYIACPWSSACVDAIARTITAGGVEAVWDGGDEDEAEAPDAPPEVVELRELLDFINPYEDAQQLCRGIITDLEVFADAYLEVVWLAERPVALYSLDVPSMKVLADEHGVITGYLQVTEAGKRVEFEPREVIHFSLDVPRSGIYGLSPTTKALLPITTWLFAAATLKEVMRKGDPLNLHVDHPKGTSDGEIKIWRQKYRTENIGPRNIGNPVTTKGGATVSELKQNAIENYIKVKTEARDEILSTYGCPPSKVGVIESGNLGGGTGTSQDKTFRVNTCGPIAGVVLEKLIYHLVRVGFGITDWTLRFRDIDWRDDQVVDDIASQRVRDGRLTLNAARAEIGQPPVDGGDEPVLIDRQNLVLWSDMADYSKANVSSKAAPGITAAAAGRAAQSQPKPAPGAAEAPAKETAPERDARLLREAWQRSYRQQRAIALAELHHATAGLRESSSARTGAYVILRVAVEQAEQLAVPGGEPAEDLHLTVAFLADPAAEYNEDTRAALQDAVTEAWFGIDHPVTADAFAVAQFNPTAGADDERQPCAVLLVQSEQLLALHDAIIHTLEQNDTQLSDQFPMWIPHITLGYGMSTDDITDRTGDITFDRLEFIWGTDGIEL